MPTKSIIRGVARSIKRLFEYDFFPKVNPYFYWLKQPVGWFVVAFFSSILVGAFFSPIGWPLAAGLLAILGIGLGFPWIAIRAASCRLYPLEAEVHERQNSVIVFEVRNRLPISLMGLMVEGYWTMPEGSADTVRPDIGLSSVPMLSIASYRLPISPDYRGIYPVRPPQLACSFPFGIWTARRPIAEVVSVTVRPLVIDLSATLELAGKRIADLGSGNRISSNGEFMGVRTFRRGDSLKSIHWVQSARIDSLVVCERGGPQQNEFVIRLRTNRCTGDRSHSRENLAWRVRIAATIADLCTARHIPFQLNIDGQAIALPSGSAGLNAALNKLATIPLDSSSKDAPMSAPSPHESCLEISVHDDGDKLARPEHLRLLMHRPSIGFRSQQEAIAKTIDLTDDISAQVNNWLREADYEYVS